MTREQRRLVRAVMLAMLFVVLVMPVALLVQGMAWLLVLTAGAAAVALGAAVQLWRIERRDRADDAAAPGAHATDTHDPGDEER